MNIKTVGVIGAGTMGNGIAHIFSKGGFNVILCDVQQPLLDKAVATIGKNMEREVAKQKLSADESAAAIKRITTTIERNALAACDFIVEAATEKFDIKAQLFRDLVCRLLLEKKKKQKHRKPHNKETSTRNHNCTINIELSIVEHYTKTCQAQ